ncbi:MAG: type II secretion system protein J [bacterium]
MKKNALQRRAHPRGLTLLELLIAMSIIAVIGVISSQVLSIAFQSWEGGSRQNKIMHEACWALDHIVSRARFSNHLVIPTAANPNQTILSFSAMVNSDPSRDGLIDEDPNGDINNDGWPGIEGMDDDGDGAIDEGGEDAKNDDDEDGISDEDPRECWEYYIDNGQLIEKNPINGELEILAERATDFHVHRVEGEKYAGAAIYLTIHSSQEEEIHLETLVYLKGLHFDPNN